MEDIARALEGEDHDALLAAIAALEPKRKKAAAKWITAQWKALRAEGRFRNSLDRREGNELWMRYLLALTAAADDPKAALAIPLRHHDRVWSTESSLVGIPPETLAALTQAAIAHGADWCAGYLALVADAKKPRPAHIAMLVMMAHAHDLALPSTNILSELWGTKFRGPTDDRGKITVLELERSGERWRVQGRGVAVTSALDTARLLPRVDVFFPALFDHRDAVDHLIGNGNEKEAMDRAADIVRALVADACVDSGVLARRAIAALSRGDSPRCQRLQVRLLMAAQPAPEVVAEQARVLVNLLASGTQAAAGAALELLRQADAASPLADDIFLDACRMAFTRKEKGLRQGQLGWAKQRGARAVTSAALGLAEALSCDDHPLQKDAATALRSLWPRVPEGAHAPLRAGIEASRGVLDEGLFQGLWGACGGGDMATPVSTAHESSTLPPRTAPQRPGMITLRFERVLEARLPAEAVHALNAYYLQRDAYQFERVLHFAARALRSSVPMAQSFAKRLTDERPWSMKHPPSQDAGREVSWIAVERLDEFRRALTEGRPVMFLSTPTYQHGAISAGHLVGRLEHLARAGQRALPYDLLVALLRTEPCGFHAISHLRIIGSPDAMVAADFLAAGGAGQLRTRWLVVEGKRVPGSWTDRYSAAQWQCSDGREVCVALDAMASPPAIEGVRFELAKGFEPANAPFANEFDMAADWITPMLPTNAEALAALHLWGFRRAGLPDGTEGGKAVVRKLPLILAAHGPAGPALHLAIFFAMSGNEAASRLAGSDGLVTLLQQGRYDGPLARELLAACIACGSVKPSRLAAALAQVREAGESEAVWELVSAAVAAALAMSPVPAATADLLELGVRTATELGTKEHIPALAAAVEGVRGKPNKLQLQAQRLQECLTR
jgi:hypothetical protein